ncbi:MAG: ATP-binding protein, partial [Roseburia sp.]|nr:ATP-binding protein [Roseburia sp.]
VRNIECEFHYIDPDDEVWKERIAHRNELVLKGEKLAYIVDKNLATKSANLFELPSESEIDVWVHY